jgi:hypothetical protein
MNLDERVKSPNSDGFVDLNDSLYMGSAVAAGSENILTRPRTHPTGGGQVRQDRYFNITQPQ